MRLTKVRVTGLFGLFNHEIPLNREARITIIHGPNGFGKTIVLRMLEALLVGRYSIFFEIPFETFAVEVEDGRCLIIESDGRTNKSDWPPDARADLPKTHLIKTQRLRVLSRTQNKALRMSKSAVLVCSEDMASRIKQVLAKYAARSQELDRTFPARLLAPREEPLASSGLSDKFFDIVVTSELPRCLGRRTSVIGNYVERFRGHSTRKLRERLYELEQKRSWLTKLGFLEPEQVVSPVSVEAIEAKREVLSVYVDDAEQKLAVFDDLAKKIELFTRIINERFLFKRLDVHRDEGFVFTSQTGARLRPSELSSGEQHELILLYELLFKLEKNALVLIDEPEISLHVAWQEKFLDDLQEVVMLSEIDVIVATHSPEIIGKHWDLTVELKGPTLPRQE